MFYSQFRLNWTQTLGKVNGPSFRHTIHVRVYMYYKLSRVRVGVGNVLCQLSDMRDTWCVTLCIHSTAWRLLYEQSGLTFDGYTFCPRSICVCCASQNSGLCPIQMRLVVNERLQNYEKRLVASCPSVHPHGTRLRKDGCVWNLIFDYFPTISRENSSFVKIWQE
jgi:hypothetical protein